MDCILPVISGYEASAYIKSLVKSHQFQDCLIIGHSSNASEDHY